MGTKETSILKGLKELFPDARSELNFANPYQLIVSVMLSAQCTDKKVNEVTPKLFTKYPDFNSLSKAKFDSIASIIRQVNYYSTKSKHLLAAAKLIMDRFDGEIPLSHKELTELPGVGRKTANVVLSELGIEHTLPVDTHVFRVSKRLGLAKAEDRDEVEEELRDKFPSKEWRALHHGLILHGRKTCKAKSPLCKECRLQKFCEYFSKS